MNKGLATLDGMDKARAYHHIHGAAQVFNAIYNKLYEPGPSVMMYLTCRAIAQEFSLRYDEVELEVWAQIEDLHNGGPMALLDDNVEESEIRPFLTV